MQATRQTIKKLQKAINIKFDQKLLYNTTQFYSEKSNSPVTVHVLKKAVWDKEKQRNRSMEIFSSTSELQIVLYLRDMWYNLNGWQIPPNEVWEQAKQKYMEKH